MKPHTYFLELERRKTDEMTQRRSANPSSALAVQPEIVSVVADAIKTFTTALTVFSSSTAAFSALTLRKNWTITDILFVSLTLTGLGIMARTVALSETLLVWVEMWTNRDLNQDGYIGEPEPEPQLRTIPVSHDVATTYDFARQLWLYTWQQKKAANGNKLRRKPWARATAIENVVGLNKESWRDAIGLWIEGGLLETVDSPEPETTSYREGLSMLDSGMVLRDCMKVNGTWVSKAAEDVTW